MNYVESSTKEADLAPFSVRWGLQKLGIKTVSACNKKIREIRRENRCAGRKESEIERRGP